MLNETHAIELLPAYALGSLDAEEATEVAAHLAVCPVCRSELASYQAVADRLALAVPDAVPPAALKQQLLGRLQTPHATPAPEARRPWWQALVGRIQSLSPAWGVATVTLLVVLVASNLVWWQQSNRHEPAVSANSMQVVAMAGTDAAPDAEGTLVISGDGEYGTLVVDGLPALDQAHQYQLWLIRGEQRTSGGVFSVNEEGYGALLISSEAPLSSYPSFGITIEPAGGSPGPTGDKVLGGSL